MLLLLFLCVALSLAGSWRRAKPRPAEHDLRPSPFGAPDADNPGRLEALAHEMQRVGRWNTAAQMIALGLCCGLWIVGLILQRSVGREAAHQEQADLDVEREERALEKRIEERTHELSQEVEERRRAEHLNRGQKQVLEMLADPRQQKTEDILRLLTVTLAEQQRSWDCSLHLMDASGKTLRLAASSEVDEKLRRYLVSIGADFPDAPEGQACCAGQPFVVEKMTDVRRPWSELLVANGIFSAWSVPFRQRISWPAR